VFSNEPSLTREVSGQPGSLREPLLLKTLRHEHARTYPARWPQSFWRIWALVQKVKIRRLGLSLHVADLAGIRNLKKMVKVEFRVVKWLQSMNHDLTRLSAPAIGILRLLKCLVFAGIA
jgi:hypothetical protein